MTTDHPMVPVPLLCFDMMVARQVKSIRQDLVDAAARADEREAATLRAVPESFVQSLARRITMDGRSAVSAHCSAWRPLLVLHKPVRPSLWGGRWPSEDGLSIIQEHIEMWTAAA